MTDFGIRPAEVPQMPIKQTARSDEVGAKAKEFEAMFLAQSFDQMFSTVDTGPFGGGHGEKMWKSILSQEYAKAVAESGDTGISRSISGMLSAYDTQPGKKP